MLPVQHGLAIHDLQIVLALVGLAVAGVLSSIRRLNVQVKGRPPWLALIVFAVIYGLWWIVGWQNSMALGVGFVLGALMMTLVRRVRSHRRG